MSERIGPLSVPAEKTAVMLTSRPHQCALSAGDVGYIDGHTLTGDGCPNAVVVRLSDGAIDYVPVYSLRALAAPSPTQSEKT